MIGRRPHPGSWSASVQHTAVQQDPNSHSAFAAMAHLRNGMALVVAQGLAGDDVQADQPRRIAQKFLSAVWNSNSDDPQSVCAEGGRAVTDDLARLLEVEDPSTAPLQPDESAAPAREPAVLATGGFLGLVLWNTGSLSYFRTGAMDLRVWMPGLQKWVPVAVRQALGGSGDGPDIDQSALQDAAAVAVFSAVAVRQGCVGPALDALTPIGPAAPLQAASERAREVAAAKVGGDAMAVAVAAWQPEKGGDRAMPLVMAAAAVALAAGALLGGRWLAAPLRPDPAPQARSLPAAAGPGQPGAGGAIAEPPGSADDLLPDCPAEDLPALRSGPAHVPAPAAATATGDGDAK